MLMTRNPGSVSFVELKMKRNRLPMTEKKLQKVKEQGKVKQVEEVVDSIKQKFGTLQQFAKSCGEMNRVIYRLCDTKEKKVDETRFSHKLASGNREEIMQYLISEENVNYIPTARHANKGYLKKPLKHSYEDFIDNRPLGRRPLSFSSFNRNIPKNIKPVSKTPHYQCTCEKCDNLKKITVKLIGNKVSGVEQNIRKAMEKTWCPFKKENHETKCFPKKICVLRSCDRCGVDKVNVSIPTGIDQYKQVHYDQWVYKNRDEKYKMMNDGKTEPLKKVCEEYINKLDDMSTHLFFDQWQHNQFQQLIKNMEPGLVVFCP